MLAKKRKNKSSVLSRLVGGQERDVVNVLDVKEDRIQSSEQGISADKYFYFADGSSAKDIEELREMIKVLNDDELDRLMQPENHFANWIEFVFGNITLANKIRRAKDRKDLLKVIKA
jgi:hypothetical protein